MTAFQVAFGFHGRIRRSVYWVASILLTLAALLVGVLVAIAMGFSFEDAKTRGDIPNSVALAGVVALIVVAGVYLWSAVAIAWKRCHDRNYPGALSLAMIAVGIIVPFGGLWQFIDLGCLDGTPGPNTYGPSPKGIGPEEVFT